MWLIFAVLFTGVAVLADINDGLESRSTDSFVRSIGDIFVNNPNIGLAAATNEAFANSFVKVATDTDDRSSNTNVGLKSAGIAFTNDPNVGRTGANSIILANNATVKEAATNDTVNNGSKLGEVQTNDSSANVPSISLAAPANATVSITNDPLSNLNDKVLISKLRLLMRNDVCGDKPFKLGNILPDILKGAKAGNCKYKCERYDCATCKVLKYKDPYVAIGNCSIWSDGLEYEINYAGKLYGDQVSYKIYFEVGKDAVGDLKPKLYKMGNETKSVSSEKTDDYVDPPTPIDFYTIHTLLSG